MGSNNHCNINFNKNFGNEDGGGGGNGRPLGSGNFGLARQSSVYSLTLDEFQNTLGGMGKDFGSMNMDELLRSLWSAEETQSMATGAGAAAMVAAAAAAVGSTGQDTGKSGAYLQTQGSLILRQKTVDEVWKDVAKEWNGGKDGGGGSNVPQKQQTLGEVTLEEFLVRAGVVGDDTQLLGKPNNGSVSGVFGNFSQPRSNTDNYSTTTNTGYGINFQQSGRGVELIGNQITDSYQQMPLQSANLPLNVNGVRTSQQQGTLTQLSQQPKNQQQQPLFPKQYAVSYAPVMTVPSNGQLGGSGMRGGMVGLGDSGINSNLIQSGVTQCGGGLGMGGAIDFPTRSPAALSSDLLGRSNRDLSSVSPVPYMFNGGLRGRKGLGAVDKVVERRQRRMIKNRESAARSRARKQAYTMELEQEVQKLKEENEDLLQKQVEIIEMQKNQVMEMMNAQPCSRKKLRRMQTGPW